VTFRLVFGQSLQSTDSSLVKCCRCRYLRWICRIPCNLVIIKPTTVAARSKAWIVLAHLNFLGLNPTRGMDASQRLFCVCVVLCSRPGSAVCLWD
jgi:hypothetical protein